MKTLLSFLAGIIVACGVIWSLMPRPKDDGYCPIMLNPKFPLQEEVSATVRIKVTEEYDSEKYLGLTTAKIVEKLGVSNPGKKAVLKQLFDSSIPTKIEFVWDENDQEQSSSFTCFMGLTQEIETNN